MEEAGSAADSEANTSSVLRLCTFYMKGDYVRRSSTPYHAIGHGWWTNVNCRATWAVVTVQLQEYYSDGVWRNVGAPGKSTVRSNGGAAARVACTSTRLTGWRSVIDVDVIGVYDPPNKLTTPGQNIYCRR